MTARLVFPLFLLGMGLMLLVPMVFAAQMSRLNPGVPVLVTDTLYSGMSYSAVLIAEYTDSATAMCSQIGFGFDPVVPGSITVQFAGETQSYGYGDYCLNANALVKFSCGYGVALNGQLAQPLGHAFTFDCQTINRVCSAGKCV